MKYLNYSVDLIILKHNVFDQPKKPFLKPKTEKKTKFSIPQKYIREHYNKSKRIIEVSF